LPRLNVPEVGPVHDEIDRVLAAPIIAPIEQLSTRPFLPFFQFSCYKKMAEIEIRTDFPLTPVDIKRIDKSDPEYPISLIHHLANDAPDSVTAIGNLAILNQRKLAIFCSAICPAEIRSQIRDLIEKLTDARVAAIGGFHSPVERECLSILLRGSQPIILFPARSLVKLRIRPEHKEPLEKGQLLFLSFFRSHRHRSDVEMAFRRNRSVAALAEKILIPFAAPGSKTEYLCRELITWGKPVYTIANEANQNLLKLGLEPVTVEQAGDLL
jgi:predicted Rossmann fold nucleotide-binding protein DprA/Smf involved in DNA uptake